MNIDNSKSFLKLQVIWKDEDMFELKVTATNGRYFGITEVYESSESLLHFAKSLVDFPKDDTVLMHEAGQNGKLGYFSMKFYTIDYSGHIGVEVSLEGNINHRSSRQEEKDRVKLEIIVQPSTIDNFQRELLQLSTAEEGIVLLQGNND
jgi:hypothetical protein